MSVLIRGMKMPTCCFYCEMCYQDQDSEHCITSRCAAQEHKEIFPDRSVRDDDCPLTELPEKHGRLIDADAINYEDEIWEKKCIPILLVYIAWLIAGEVPTILEAEDGT